MGLFLMRFWPVLLPILTYFLWMFFIRNKARKASEPVPHFREGPVFWTLIATLGIAIAMFFVLGLSNDPIKGVYVPSHIENGKVIPSQIR
jgi:heme/copper-type cytochrome/quinol oxidase subunit 2